jgi:DNA-binding response OmpR family regulator
MSDSRTVLIVDDDRDLAEGIRVMIGRLGLRTVVVHNGIDAKQAIADRKPDLVIMDMMMPRMGGYPVLESLQGRADAPPVIMMTANEGSRHKAYAEYLGVIDYIRKPFAMERLLEAVRQALGPVPPDDDATGSAGATGTA